MNILSFLLNILTLVGIFSIIAYSLNLVAGYAGLLSLAQAAFFGIGAYSTALLTTQLGWPFLGSVAFGIFLSSIISIVISLPSLRIKGDYFAITTMAFQMVAYSIFHNWYEVTGGPRGITRIPNASLFGLRIDTPAEYFIFCWIIGIGVLFLCKKISKSPYGRVLLAIREDEIFSKSLGKNIFYYKVSIFIISAALASLTGSLYATYAQYISSSSFDVMESIFFISIIIIGGAANSWGPLIGALILVPLPQLLRFIGLSGAVAGYLRQIIFGSLLVFILLFRPKGIIPEKILH